MGSWHGTCALSNLDIRYHNDVVAILLVEQDREYGKGELGGGFCGTQKFCNPLAFPLRGLYDDGGALEEIEKDETTEAFVKWVNESEKMKVKSGKEGKLDTIDNIVQAIERGYVYIEEGRKKLQVGLMLIHRYIYNEMMDFARKDKKIKHNFECLTKFAGRDVADHLRMVRSFKKTMEEKERSEEFIRDALDGDYDAAVSEEELTFENIMAMGGRSRRAFLYRFKNVEGDNWKHCDISVSDPKKYEEVLYFYLLMDCLRKQYVIQGGAGSQDRNDHAITVLCNVTKNTIEIRENEEKEW
jgi:hypothetical protein